MRGKINVPGGGNDGHGDDVDELKSPKRIQFVCCLISSRSKIYDKQQYLSYIFLKHNDKTIFAS